jgi:hypothetical protein
MSLRPQTPPALPSLRAGAVHPIKTSGAVRRSATRKIVQMWNISHGGLLYIRMKASAESYSQIALCSASVRFFFVSLCAV